MLLYKSITIIILSVSLFNFSSCGNAKTGVESVTFQDNPPFVLKQVISQKWIAGVKEGGSGTTIDITASEIKEGVVFKDLYFRGQVTEIKINPRNKEAFKASFIDEKKDLIMDINPVAESQNTPRTAFPFEIKLFEAVLSYEYQNTLSYVKITDVIEKEVLALPSQNPNGGLE